MSWWCSDPNLYDSVLLIPSQILNSYHSFVWTLKLPCKKTCFHHWSSFVHYVMISILVNILQEHASFLLTETLNHPFSLLMVLFICKAKPLKYGLQEEGFLTKWSQISDFMGTLWKMSLIYVHDDFALYFVHIFSHILAIWLMPSIEKWLDKPYLIMFIFLVSSVVTYDLAPLCARTSAGTVRTKLGHAYIQEPHLNYW